VTQSENSKYDELNLNKSFLIFLLLQLRYLFSILAKDTIT